MIVRKWAIYRAELDPVIGSEQGKSRPVLVISEDIINDLLNIVNVIPITSRKVGRTIYPNEVLIPSNNFGQRLASAKNHRPIALFFSFHSFFLLLPLSVYFLY